MRDIGLPPCHATEILQTPQPLVTRLWSSETSKTTHHVNVTGDIDSASKWPILIGCSNPVVLQFQLHWYNV